MGAMAHSVLLPHALQVWGIVSFVVVIGLSTTFRLINGIISTLSVIPTHRTGDATVFFDFIMKKLLLFLALLGTFTVGCDKDDLEDSNVVEDEIVNPSGLPKPKANEIYYTTTDGVILDLGDKNFYSTVSSHEVKNGIFVLTFVQDLSQISKSIEISFKDVKRLQSIRLPEGITAIGNFAFNECSSLKSITIPESVTSIGENAFQGCSSLTNITLPESVTSIREAAFLGCSSLTSIPIPEGVTSIGSAAFSSCSSLTSITIPESVTSIGRNVFNKCKGELKIYGKFIEGKLNYAEYHWLKGASFAKITIGDNITKLGAHAFDGCGFLTNIIIPEGVTKIGGSAFEGCSSLTSITIPESVTSIEYSAFKGCSSLTSITLPESVTSIGHYAFEGCSSLTNITIPESVLEIGSLAFGDCSSLKRVYCKRTEPSKQMLERNYEGYYCSSIYWEAFYKTADNINILVPRESVEAYKLAEGWKDYADAIVGYDFN